MADTRQSINAIKNGFGFGRGITLALVRNRASTSLLPFDQEQIQSSVRDIPSFGAFFYTYELLVGTSTNWLNFNGNTGFGSKERIENFWWYIKRSFYRISSISFNSFGKEQLLETSKVIFAGGCAGVNSWIITYPVDVVKTQIQAQHLGTTHFWKQQQRFL